MIKVNFLGRIGYLEALSLMNNLRAQRILGECEDQLLFLEHPAVITMGRRKSEEDLLLPVEKLREKNIDFIKTDRGGRLTCHGPGQLVIYFIINLEQKHLKVGDLVCLAEEGIKLFLRELSIEACRDKINPGLWVNNKKIASLGFHIHRGISTHGVALNLYNDLTPFNYMIPCGIANRGVTSVYEETGARVELEAVTKSLSALYQSRLDHAESRR